MCDRVAIARVTASSVARARVGSRVSEVGMTDPLVPCELHELSSCGLCHPPNRTYRRGRAVVDVPHGHFVEVRGGKGVYHHLTATTSRGTATERMSRRL